VLYDLFAVSSHYGGLGVGHYVAFGKNFENQQWYKFDDSLVSLADEAKVAASTQTAYVLFYQRKE